MSARILVVDDDTDLRTLLKAMLQRDGYEVVEAADGEQGWARAVDSAPSLILLDVMMPGPDGFETCRKLKSDSRTNAVPVIFISAKIDQRSRVEGLRLGAEDYLNKPIEYKDLRRRVGAAIQLKDLSRRMGSARPDGP